MGRGRAGGGRVRRALRVRRAREAAPRWGVVAGRGRGACGGLGSGGSVVRGLQGGRARDPPWAAAVWPWARGGWTVGGSKQGTAHLAHLAHFLLRKGYREFNFFSSLRL